MNLTELETRAQALFAHEAYAQNMVPLPGDKTACPLLLFTQQLCTGPVKTVFVEHNWANREGNKSYTQAMSVDWVRQVYDGACDPTLRPLLCTPWSRACFQRGDTVALNALVGLTGAYLHDHRSAPVTFAGPASWPSVLAFEKILEQGLIVNDGSFGWATDPTVRDKWQQVSKLGGYPSFLWENTGDDPIFGRVNGRRAISSTQLGAGQVIFGKWSEMLICSWVGVEILVDPFSLAPQAEIRVRSSLLADIAFRYPLAFSCSSDSGAQ